MIKQITRTKRVVAFLVALMVLSGCGYNSSITSQKTTDNMEKEAPTAETEIQFPYAINNYGGYTYTFLNVQEKS